MPPAPTPPVNNMSMPSSTERTANLLNLLKFSGGPGPSQLQNQAAREHAQAHAQSQQQQQPPQQPQSQPQSQDDDRQSPEDEITYYKQRSKGLGAVITGAANDDSCTIFCSD